LHKEQELTAKEEQGQVVIVFVYHAVTENRTSQITPAI
jgi:hypothetical protein